MAAGDGRVTIKKLITSLLVIGAIACGAVYMALTSGPVVVKKADTPPAARPLAYEQQINRPDTSAPAPEENAPGQQAAAPAEQPEAAPAEADQNSAANADAEAGPSNDDPSQMAALPHNGDVTVSEPGALPWQKPDPARQGEGPDGSGPGAQGEDAYPPDPMAAAPGPDADPNAYPAQPEEEPQEWVQVLVSGAGMHGAASEDAPALFAFPYGRTLRVVSRYENWVEVTDPQSAATGWMKAQYLAPAPAPGAPPQSDAWYDDQQPRQRHGWFQRNGGGFADMINRALGGH